MAPSVLDYWTSRGSANSRTTNSWTSQLVDWTARGLVKSRTRQLADNAANKKQHDLLLINFSLSSASQLHTLTTTPQPFYGSYPGTTRMSRCQKRTSGLYGARED